MPVRLYEEKDFDYLVDMDIRCFSHAWSRGNWESSLKMEQYRCYILEEHGTYQGFLLISEALDEAEVLKIGVLEEYRGNANGAKLLRQAFEQWKEDGIRTIFLEVRRSNVSARTLYEKMNFEEIGVRKRYYKNPIEDAVLYSCQQFPLEL